ncbi:hypothetical protein OH786_37780 (plasmid) [Streptomyces atratus]|uniref:Uncharacterized protein n=1 Tax=Streptomyces atratus TaxID=1893 RepID=A0A1K2FBG3_STRAR|nr:hypothetical protein [Streptomyces atratus]SFY44790.1 hypothetical protein SAMN02787144_105315 [Streptomyces atratus]
MGRLAVTQEHSSAEADRLTAPGGEALLLKGAVTLVLSRTRWPAEVTYTQLSSGPHSANWTEIKGTGPATTQPDPIAGSHTERDDGPQPGAALPDEHSETVRRPKSAMLRSCRDGPETSA